MTAGALLPLAGEVVDYLQTLDWRQYVLASDRKNLAVLAIDSYNSQLNSRRTRTGD